MGYRTDFKLEVDSEDKLVIVAEFVSEFQEADYAIDVKGNTRNQTKWYQHVYDLCVFSERYPEVIFTLKGEGEETGNIWVKYFLNGHCAEYKAEIVLPQLNKDDLVPFNEILR